MPNHVTPSEVANEICLKNDYSFDQEIGHGGFKHTYRVFTKEGLPWALKVFQNTAKTERTVREISAMTRCSHRGITKIASISQINIDGDSYLYMIEEYVGGGTLTARLKQGIMSRDEVIDFGNQMIDIIDYISSLGLVHRDIKPDNILFRDVGVSVVLTDFGIVRDLGEVSLTPTFLASAPGTHGFAAPEQETNQKNLENWRTDQFSCGIVFSLCALGMHPFGTTLLEAYQAISTFGDTLPDFKTAIKTTGYYPIQKMVEVWPVNRYRLVQDLRAAWNS